MAVYSAATSVRNAAEVVGLLMAGPATAQSAPPAKRSLKTTSPWCDCTVGPIRAEILDAVATALEKSVTKVDQQYSQQIAKAPASDKQRIVEEAIM